MAEVVTLTSMFWDDLVADLDNPEFLRDYLTESVRIASIDAVINALDEARVSAGLSKAALARAIGAEPAAVRRLLSSGTGNPTLGTVAEIAAALGLRISVEPLPDDEKEAVTIPLRTGQVTNRTRDHIRRSTHAERRPNPVVAA